MTRNNDDDRVHVHFSSHISTLSPEQLRQLPAHALAKARLQRLEQHVLPPASSSSSRGSSNGWDKCSNEGPRDADRLPELTWDEVGKHNTREECWVAIEGIVYDLSDFLAAHPGGEALVLDAAAGGDATDIFYAIHDPKVLALWGGTVVPKVGRVSGAMPPELGSRIPWGGWQPATAHQAAHQRIQRERSLPVVLDSPFPHGRFEDERLEAVRFQWADYSRLTEPNSGEHETFSQKSKLHVLDVERDWLDCDARKYAAEMSMRHAILSSPEFSDAVYVGQGTGTEAHAAEAELLAEVLEWLPARYPDRFNVHRIGGVIASVETLTAGYQHTFTVADYADAPLKLAALLVQEEFYLMIESKADPNDAQHPSGRKHTLAAGVSIFAFDIHEKVNMSMSQIHNKNVPGWQLQLQQNMNHVFTNMEPEISWLRHNWLFQDYQEVLHPYFPWSPHVVAKRPDVYPKLPVSQSGWWESKDLRLKTAADVAERVSLRVEYQTLRRLPATRAIAFTVRSYVDPLQSLEAAPGAAAALAANLRRRYKGSFFYFALGRAQSQQALLEYLDSVSLAGGVPVWKEVLDPWERAAVEDGTWAADADRAEMAGSDGVQVARNVEGLNAFKADAVSDEARAMVLDSAVDKDGSNN